MHSPEGPLSAWEGRQTAVGAWKQGPLQELADVSLGNCSPFPPPHFPCARTHICQDFHKQTRWSADCSVIQHLGAWGYKYSAALPQNMLCR